MSQCDRCKKEITMTIVTNERPFKGGVLQVTEVPVQKCDCDEQVLIGDGALMAGYARFLQDRKIVGKVTVSLNDLKSSFTIQDFLPTM